MHDTYRCDALTRNARHHIGGSERFKMGKLKETINGQQVVSLLYESDTTVSLGLLDPQTGAMQRVDIVADMAVLPDEAVLSIEVSEVRDNSVDLTAWWERGDLLTEGDAPRVFTWAEPSPTWMITPQGQEVDLRVHVGGLF